MQMTIHEATGGLYLCMLDYGIKKRTAQNYKYQYLYPLRKFYEANDTSEYQSALTLKYLEVKRKQWSDGQIGESN